MKFLWRNSKSKTISQFPLVHLALHLVERLQKQIFSSPIASRVLSAWTTIHLRSYHHYHLPSRLHTNFAPSPEPLRIPPSQCNLAFSSSSQLSSAILSPSHCCLFSFDVKFLPNDMTDWTSPSYLLTLISECQVLVLCMASDTVSYHIVERHSQAVRHFSPSFSFCFLGYYS